MAAERQAAVTFLFSDIEGSTRLVQRLGDGFGAVREAYAAIVRRAIGEAGGVEVSTEGDSFFVVFASPAGLTLGSVETTVGRYDDALRHLTEARDLAVRLDNAWLTATSQVLLGALALVQGRLEDAQALLEEALELSLAAHSTRSVTLCLTAFAQLALVQGDAERAALLAPSSTSGRQSTPSAVGPAPAPGHPERWPRCHTNQAFELVSESTRTS